ncbi:MAG: DUF4093 domain-containing protein [Oscillospiraceae bacterium]|jgi:ribonuclease M5|nr:DUF4093 domain-containing protein [Oscillospiraceae bacterium]
MKRRVAEVIVVEGRYDKNTVAQAVDATVIETSGFGVFSDEEKVALLRRLAAARGLIILTDSDGAGFLIRNHLKGMLGGTNVKHAYIPDVRGRERRKRAPSKEGKLGVEGMSPEVIVAALERAGATFTIDNEQLTIDNSGTGDAPFTKADFYALGLTGTRDSSARRAELLARLSLPSRLTANGLLEVVNLTMTRAEFSALVADM